MQALDSMTTADQDFLRAAVDYLERPRFLLKIANLAGRPAEVVLAALPSRAQSMVAGATAAALHNALGWAVRTLPTAATKISTPPDAGIRFQVARHWHTALTATTGAVGGFFGLGGMAVEFPATTTLMLRSIAAIAAEEGADLSDPSVRLQCLSVFSFGAPTMDSLESAYFTGRLGLAMAVQDAARFLAQHGARETGEAIARGTAPVLVRLVNQIAARFQVVVSQKMAAQLVPIAGAASGALINAAFTDHFNTVARYHFGIVRLERRYGPEVVQHAYQNACLHRAGAA